MRGDGIHTATTADVAELADLHRRSSLVYDDTRDALLSRPELFGVSAVALDDGHVRILVRRGRIIGFATLLPGEDGSGELDDLFVDPDYLRQGFGRALIDDAKASAQKCGALRIEVTANANSAAIYRKLGFVGEREVVTRLGHGLRMSLDLSDA